MILSRRTLRAPRARVLCLLMMVSLPAGPAAAGADSVADVAQEQEVIQGTDCECTRSYLDGTAEQTADCEGWNDECLSLSMLVHCQANPGDPACRDGLDACECQCEGDPVQVYAHDPEDGVYLTGIPNLWQHDTLCTDVGIPVSAPVGCGAISTAMLMYWYEAQGYTGLAARPTLDFGDVVRDWQTVAEDIARIQPELCTPFATATLPSVMATSIEAYVDAFGSGNLGASVLHWKVCDGCNTNAPDERLSEQGLEIIQAELEAGRPLILGFNHGRAQSSQVQVDGETVFTGKLSNGTPGIGTITHYGVITGYRRSSDGRDVIYVNMGQTSSTGFTHDFAFEWNPAGKWVHLYEVSLDAAPTGPPSCPMDAVLSTGTLSGEFFPLVHPDGLATLALSHVGRAVPWASETLTPVAGASCGVARGNEYEIVTPQWNEFHECAHASYLPEGQEGVVDPNAAGGSESPWHIDSGLLDPIQLP